MSDLRVESLICVMTVLALSACSRQEPSTTEPASAGTSTASAPDADASGDVAAPEVPADSGLAIKRGVMMLAQDRTTFRPCGETSELWVLDQTDGLLAGAFAGDAAATTPTMLYVEAYGERAPVDDQTPDARGYAGVFVLEEVLYAGLQDAVKGCAAAPTTAIVSARGTEPFWAVEVHEAQMLWRQPEDPKEIALSAPQTEDAEGAVRYRASGGGHTIEVSIDSQPCRDAMSGEFFAYSAKAVLDGKEFSGCARVGR